LIVFENWKEKRFGGERKPSNRRALPLALLNKGVCKKTTKHTRLLYHLKAKQQTKKRLKKGGEKGRIYRLRRRFNVAPEKRRNSLGEIKRTEPAGGKNIKKGDNEELHENLTCQLCSTTKARRGMTGPKRGNRRFWNHKVHK